MAENIIKIELGEESRKLLETLLQEIRVISDTTELIRLAMGSAGTPFEAPAPEQPAPAAEEPPAAPEPAPEKKIDRETVRKLVMDLSGTDKKPQVREIVQTYARSVTDLPEDKLAEVWDKLVELEQQKKVRL